MLSRVLFRAAPRRALTPAHLAFWRRLQPAPFAPVRPLSAALNAASTDLPQQQQQVRAGGEGDAGAGGVGGASEGLENAKQALVVGGVGSLGKAVVESFVQAGWRCTSVDLYACDYAHQSVVLQRGGPLAERSDAVMQALGGVEKAKGAFHAVVNVAGGWAGGIDINDGKEWLVRRALRGWAGVGARCRLAAQFLSSATCCFL